jgi:hypothetical protein
MTAPEQAAAPVADPGAALDIHLAEYKALKDEQRARIDRRDYTVLGTFTAVAAAAAAASKLPAALLLLPLVTLVLGWTHLATDQMISAVGRYLREDLGVRLSALAGQPMLGWESHHAGDTRRQQRKRLQLAIDLLTFPVPALVSVGTYLALVRPPLVGWIAALLLAVAALLLANQQRIYAEGIRRPAPSRS